MVDNYRSRLERMVNKAPSDPWQTDSSSGPDWNKKSTFDPWKSNDDFSRARKETSRSKERDFDPKMRSSRELLTRPLSYVRPSKVNTNPFMTNVKAKIELDDEFVPFFFEEEPITASLNDKYVQQPRYQCQKHTHDLSVKPLGSPIKLTEEALTEANCKNTSCFISHAAPKWVPNRADENLMSGGTVKQGAVRNEIHYSSPSFKEQSGATAPQVINHYHCYHYNIYQLPPQPVPQFAGGQWYSTQPIPTPAAPSAPSFPFPACAPYTKTSPPPSPGKPAPFVHFYQRAPGYIPQPFYRFSPPMINGHNFGYTVRESISDESQFPEKAFGYPDANHCYPGLPHYTGGNATHQLASDNRSFISESASATSFSALSHSDGHVDAAKLFGGNNADNLSYARGMDVSAEQPSIKPSDGGDAVRLFGGNTAVNLSYGLGLDLAGEKPSVKRFDGNGEVSRFFGVNNTVNPSYGGGIDVSGEKSSVKRSHGDGNASRLFGGNNTVNLSNGRGIDVAGAKPSGKRFDPTIRAPPSHKRVELHNPEKKQETLVDRYAGSSFWSSDSGASASVSEGSDYMRRVME